MKYALLVAALLFLLFSVLLSRDLIDYRISELDFLLGQRSQLEEMANTLSIVTRYELIRGRIEAGEGRLEQYALEARAMTVTPSASTADVRATRGIVPVQLLLRPLHALMGKPTFTPDRLGEDLDLLDVAYYWERNRGYRQAIERYEAAKHCGKDLRPQIRASILLHQGFCHSMMNEYDDARARFTAAARDYPDTDAGILAWKLLDFLDSVESTRRGAARGGEDLLEAGRRSYFLMEYREATARLSLYLDSLPPGGNAAEARYFKGRAHEELGEIEEAMREYRAVLLDPSDRKWALEAGRRMYMLGVFYGYPEALEEGSLQAWIGTLQDTEFLATVAPYSGEDPLRRIAQMHRLGGREDAAMKEEVSATEEVSAVAAAVESAVGSGEAPSASDPGVAEPAVDAVRPPLPGAGEPVAAKVAEPASAHPARTETRSRPEAPSVSPVGAGRGSLHVQAPARQLQVFLDATSLGPLREEPFQDLEPGEYRLELRGDGRELPPVYALASVEIRAGELTRLSAEPLPYGEIEYRLPETAVAVVVGPAGQVILEGAGQLRFLPAGEYTIEVRRQGYEGLELNASLVEGQIFPLSPQLRRLAPAEEPPSRGTGVAAPQPNVLPAGAGRASTPRGFPPEGELPPSGSGEAAGIGGGGTPLPGYNPESRLSALIAEREALQQRLERARRSRKGLTVGAWVSYGVGAAALGGMGAAIYFGNQSHQDYQDAIYTEDAVALREQTQTYQLIAVVSGIFGGLGVGGGTLFAALSPQLRRIENRVELLDREISRLRR